MEAFTMMTPAQMDGAYAALTTADEERDAEVLSVLSWQLYAELDEANARNNALRASLTAAAIALRPVASQPRRGMSSQALCAGCGALVAAEACLFCGQLQDLGCGHGLDHSPPASGQASRWKCTACRATVADDPAAAGASP
jgi:hypothetical protein